MLLLKNIFKGFIIGSGLILPGVSGAVLAVILGVYEKLIKALSHFKDDWKNNLFFLLPILSGMLLGIYLFGNILSLIFNKFPMEAKYTFIGLILGGVPFLIIHTKQHGTKKVNYLYLLMSLLIASLLCTITYSHDYVLDIPNISFNLLGFIFLFITGFIYISGKIIPGISSSLLLITIGMYGFFLKVVSSPLSLKLEEYIQLIPIVLGIIVGGILLLRLVEYLMIKHYNNTYSIIIGFVIGSIPAIYPGLSLDIHGTISIALLLLSFLISFKFSMR